MRLTRHIHVTEPQRAVDLLANATGLSKAILKSCMEKGCVWLKRAKTTEQRIRKAKFLAREQDTISIYYDDAILKNQPPPPVCIAHEGRYSIWDKPANMLSQGTRYGDHCSLLRLVEISQKDTSTTFLIHRLDREARGLMLFAHDKDAAAIFSDLFQKRKVEKRYQAIVHGSVQCAGGKETISTPLDGKTAETDFSLLHYDPIADTSLLDVSIHTGRLHQIRRHLSSIGHPLVGDFRYSGITSDKAIQLQLTACKLSFLCPITHAERAFTLPKFGAL